MPEGGQSWVPIHVVIYIEQPESKMQPQEKLESIDKGPSKDTSDIPSKAVRQSKS
jgi:hypothetical protein